MQQVTAEQLHDDPRFYYLSEPGYIAAIRELLNGRQTLANLKNQRYSTAKINDDRKDIIDKFLQDYQAVYDSFTKHYLQNMNTIQQSYSEPNNEQFTDELDALNELLRRQSAKAKYSLIVLKRSCVRYCVKRECVRVKVTPPMKPCWQARSWPSVKVCCHVLSAANLNTARRMILTPAGR